MCKYKLFRGKEYAYHTTRKKTGSKASNKLIKEIDFSLSTVFWIMAGPESIGITKKHKNKKGNKTMNKQSCYMLVIDHYYIAVLISSKWPIYSYNKG